MNIQLVKEIGENHMGKNIFTHKNFKSNLLIPFIQMYLHIHINNNNNNLFILRITLQYMKLADTPALSTVCIVGFRKSINNLA